MTPNPAEVSPAPSDAERVGRICAAVESDYGSLKRAVAARVKDFERYNDRGRLDERVDEVVNETVCRALSCLGSYEPDRPAFPWLLGIADNVVRGEARDVANRQARIEALAARDMDCERLVGFLASAIDSASARIDVEQMLSRLSPSDRAAIEARFFRGLDGREIADALGLPSPGAARVRVCRALQALRNLFAAGGPEVSR